MSCRQAINVRGHCALYNVNETVTLVDLKIKLLNVKRWEMCIFKAVEFVSLQLFLLELGLNMKRNIEVKPK